ncbi:macrodomain Ter protein MatP [Vibrio sp.]|nr:macrodomain Ter protein MatP [Vibrio sp.]
MKYQQLDNLECGWKWEYLVKKWKSGVAITCHIDTSEAEQAIKRLVELESEPTQVIEWIDAHMSDDLIIKLNQAIRAKRKRHFNAEQIHTRKKSIDLDYRVWERLAQKSDELGCTLSETIEYLLSEASKTEEAKFTMTSLKDDLSDLLG